MKMSLDRLEFHIRNAIASINLLDKFKSSEIKTIDELKEMPIKEDMQQNQ